MSYDRRKKNRELYAPGDVVMAQFIKEFERQFYLYKQELVDKTLMYVSHRPLINEEIFLILASYNEPALPTLFLNRWFFVLSSTGFGFVKRTIIAPLPPTPERLIIKL
jgi:hypothetical protein